MKKFLDQNWFTILLAAVGGYIIYKMYSKLNATSTTQDLQNNNPFANLPSLTGN